MLVISSDFSEKFHVKVPANVDYFRIHRLGLVEVNESLDYFFEFRVESLACTVYHFKEKISKTKYFIVSLDLQNLFNSLLITFFNFPFSLKRQKEHLHELRTNFSLSENIRETLSCKLPNKPVLMCYQFEIDQIETF